MPLTYTLLSKSYPPPQTSAEWKACLSLYKTVIGFGEFWGGFFIGYAYMGLDMQDICIVGFQTERHTPWTFVPYT